MEFTQGDIKRHFLDRINDQCRFITETAPNEVKKKKKKNPFFFFCTLGVVFLTPQNKAFFYSFFHSALSPYIELGAKLPPMEIQAMNLFLYKN